MKHVLQKVKDAAKNVPGLRPAYLAIYNTVLTVRLTIVALICLLIFANEKHKRARALPSEIELSEGRLTVGMDAMLLGRDREGKTVLTGLERYVFELATKIGRRDDIDVRVYVSVRPRQAGVLQGHLREEKIQKIAPFRFHTTLARDVAQRKVGLLHLLYTDLNYAYMIPLAFAKTAVITIHDVIPLLMPGHFSELQQKRYIRVLTWACRRAHAIILDSEHTQRDLEKFVTGFQDKAHVVYIGVDPRFCPPTSEQVEALKKKYDLPESFVLTVGRSFPHKNQALLVRAVHTLRQKYGSSIQLVLAGPTDHDAGVDELNVAIKEVDGKSWVRWVGNVDDIDMPTLYGAATAFAFPSRYEGFGLPPLEAMACGAPVVCSNAASLPEVVGDAGILVDPSDKDGFAKALNDILTDAGLAAELRRKGLERAKTFSWDATVEHVINVYKLAEERSRQQKNSR
jgi:glycosyltransferase involved in cell wall biosynthesis